MDVNYIVNQYNSGISSTVIAKNLNVDAKTVLRYLRSNSVQIRKPNGRSKGSINNWKTQIDRFGGLYNLEQYVIGLYNTGLSIPKMASLLNVSHTPIITSLQRNNISLKTITDYRKYSVNDHIFSDLTKEQSSYLLGFITADGGICGTQLKISLGLKDEQHLLKIRESFQSNAKIEYRKDKDGVTIRISSPQIITDLQKYGVGECKSHTVQWPSNLPENSYKHYIRDLMDGDGCFSSAHYKYNKPYIRCEVVSGNIDYLIGLQYYLNKVLYFPITNLIKSTNQQAWYLRYHGNDLSTKLYQYLYDNCNLFLERKRDKLNSMLQQNGVII